MSDVGIRRGQTNVHGETIASVTAREQQDQLTAALDNDQLDVERSRGFSSTTMARMRTEWPSDYSPAISRMQDAVQDILLDRFAAAYQIMFDIFDIVRKPAVNEDTGEVETDSHGMPVYERTPNGAYVEDWTLLSVRDRENFLLQITTSLFLWQQEAADLWGEAMFSKGVWTESFSYGFEQPERGTVDARTARGNVASAEDRYFAIYVSLLSRKADALVAAMERISLRLRDTIKES